MLEYVILGCILDKEMTGYEIKQGIERGIGLFYKASYGSLYPLLKKLSDREAVTVREAPEGKRMKKYYQATEKGKEEFFSWLKDAESYEQERGTLLVRVYFMDRLTEEERAPLFEAYEREKLAKLAELEKLAAHFGNGEDCYYYKLSTLSYGIVKLKAELSWYYAVRKRQPFQELLAAVDDLYDDLNRKTRKE